MDNRHVRVRTHFHTPLCLLGIRQHCVSQQWFAGNEYSAILQWIFLMALGGVLSGMAERLIMFLCVC